MHKKPPKRNIDREYDEYMKRREQKRIQALHDLLNGVPDSPIEEDDDPDLILMDEDYNPIFDK